MKNKWLWLLSVASLLSFSRLELAQFNKIKIYDSKTPEKSSLFYEFIPKNQVFVLIFHSFQCPYNLSSEKKVNNLIEQFQSDSIKFIYLNSNPFEINNIKNDSIWNNYISRCSCPYLLDKKLEVKNLLNVEKNGTYLVGKINKTNQMEIYYEGPLDNDPMNVQVDVENYLEIAIEKAKKLEPTDFQLIETGCRILNH